LQDSADGVKDFEPEIRFFAFGESMIKLKAFLRVNNYSAQFEMRSEFIKRIHSRYNKEGIHIPYPTHSVLIKKES
jgi:small-conductance mechanosensitive channel